jgi:hypothetical protein
MATSILRKRAHANQLDLHAIIAEMGAVRSSETMAIEPGNRMEDGVMGVFPTCYVEEIPFMEELATTPEPQAMATNSQDGSAPKDELADDIPGCIVEEILWMDDYNPTSHAVQATIKEEAQDKACAEGNADETRPTMKEEVTGAELLEIEARVGKNVEVGDAILDDAGNELHGTFLREEHLALVFKL